MLAILRQSYLILWLLHFNYFTVVTESWHFGLRALATRALNWKEMGLHPFHLILSLWHSFYPFVPFVESQYKFLIIQAMVSFIFDVLWYLISFHNQILDLEFIHHLVAVGLFGVTYGHDTPRSQQPRCSPGILVHAALWSLKSRHPKDQTYSDPCQNGSITNLTSVHPQVSKGSLFLTDAYMRNRNPSARDLLWSAHKYMAGSRGLRTQCRGGEEYASTCRYPIWTTKPNRFDSDSDSLKRFRTYDRTQAARILHRNENIDTACDCNLLPAFCSSVTQRTFCSCSWKNSGTECGVESLAPFMSSYLIQLHIGSMQVTR